ncbi:hypothetical protein DRJ19_06075 [Candidatus Woesearchaeota archaeon]|nr:MAG: hypothetical protein DRJ19_06075 [Candidatus Woesearchaeota archaeon]
MIFHKSSPRKGSCNFLPKVSFIIPTLNSGRTLEKCLESIFKQEYPNIEVIIIDGGSVDNTVKIAKKYNTKILRVRGPLGVARQVGVVNSSGELIANWDSDVYIPYRRWLKNAVQTLLQYPEASTLWILNKAPPQSTLVQKAYHWYSWRMMLTFAKRGYGFWGGGISIYRKKMVDEVGGFDIKDDTGEDFTMARKLALKGYKVIFYDDYVYHDTFSSLSQLIRKDLRRSYNFKKSGIKRSTGIPVSDIIKVSTQIALMALGRFFTRRKLFLLFVPIIILIRLSIYAITWVLS